MPQTFPSEVLFLRRSEPEAVVGVSQIATQNLRTDRKPSTSVRDVVSRLRSTSDDSVQYVDPAHSGSSLNPHFLDESSADGEFCRYVFDKAQSDFANSQCDAAGLALASNASISTPSNVREAQTISHVDAASSHVDLDDKHPNVAANVHWPSSVLRLCEEYRSQWRRLRAMIGSRKVVGVLGLNAGCGTTTVAATIARMLSVNSEGDNNSTANSYYLIDGNLRNPTLSQTLQTTDRWPWTDWNQDSRVEPTLPADGRLSVWSLTCAIFDPKLDTRADGAPNSISYYLPQAASGPVVSRLFQLLNHAGQRSRGTIVDLGDCDFWTRLGFLEKLAPAVDTLILVVPRPLDHRQVSIAYWKLQQSGMKSCVVVENGAVV